MMPNIIMKHSEVTEVIDDKVKYETSSNGKL